jgi:hypothetical protein
VVTHDTHDAVPLPPDAKFPCMVKGCDRDAVITLEDGKGGAHVCGQHFAEFERQMTEQYSMVRLSVPGNVCVHCGTVIGQPLQCPGCDWVDPLTRSPDA